MQLDLPERVLEAMADGVVADAAGRILYVNSELETLSGYSRDQLQGHSVELLVPARLTPGTSSTASATWPLRRGGRWGTELDIRLRPATAASCRWTSL